MGLLCRLFKLTQYTWLSGRLKGRHDRVQLWLTEFVAAAKLLKLVQARVHVSPARLSRNEKDAAAFMQSTAHRSIRRNYQAAHSTRVSTVSWCGSKVSSSSWLTSPSMYGSVRTASNWHWGQHWRPPSTSRASCPWILAMWHSESCSARLTTLSRLLFRATLRSAVIHIVVARMVLYGHVATIPVGSAKDTFRGLPLLYFF